MPAKKYRFKDLRPGDAYYGAWREKKRRVKRLLLGTALLLAGITSTLLIANEIALMADQRGGIAGFLQIMDKRILMTGTLGLFMLVMALFLREDLFEWPCPRCGKSFMFPESKGAGIAGLVVAAGCALWGLWPSFQSGANAIFGYLWVLSAPMSLIGFFIGHHGFHGLRVLQIVRRKRLNWWKDAPGSKTCIHCALPIWAPDDPDKAASAEAKGN